MQQKFRQELLLFYKKCTENRQFSDLLNHALDRYLTYSQFENDKNKQKQKDAEEVKSHRSYNSTISTDSNTKIRKLFSSQSFITSLLFSYFLYMIKSRRIEKLNMVFKNASDLLKKYDKSIRQDQRKRFLTKLIKFNEELLYLSSKIDNHCKIDWLYYEIFCGFQAETHLFAQLISSFGDGLETIQKLKNNQYCNLLASLNIHCFVFDYQKKEGSQLGGGDVRLYLGKKPESYFVASEKQHERAVMIYGKENKERKNSLSPGSSLDPKKTSSSKYKQQFLSELGKLKQQYEANTEKIANLFNFKESQNDQEKISDDGNHI